METPGSCAAPIMGQAKRRCARRINSQLHLSFLILAMVRLTVQLHDPARMVVAYSGLGTLLCNLSLQPLEDDYFQQSLRLPTKIGNPMVESLATVAVIGDTSC